MKMKQLFVSVSLGAAITFSRPAYAQTAETTCPNEITIECLESIADKVISKATTDGNARAELALQTARAMKDKSPTYAKALADKYAADVPDFDLSFLEEKDDKSEAAIKKKTRIRLLDDRDKRIQNPKPRYKALDIISTAGKLSGNGFQDDAKATHLMAVDVLKDSPKLLDSLRLARLMKLYGWPQATKPWLGELYDKFSAKPKSTGVYIAKFMSVAHIIGDEAMEAKIREDLKTYYKTASKGDLKWTHQAEVRALAESGQIETAKKRAAVLGLTLDEAYCDLSPSIDLQEISKVIGAPLNSPICYNAKSFLDEETSYTPEIFPDTIVRYEAIMAALETEGAKDIFLRQFIDRLIRKKAYPALEAELSRSRIDEEMRAKIILALMKYHAGHSKKDPGRAADIFFGKPSKVTVSFPNVAYLESYPLTLTTAGLWETYDSRAEVLSKIALGIWKTEQAGRRYGEKGLIDALARVGKFQLIEDWFKAATPKEQLGILEFAIRGATEGGYYDERRAYLIRARKLFPSATKSLDAIEMQTLRVMADNDDLSAARTAWNQAPAVKSKDLQSLVSLANVESRVGLQNQATEMSYEMLDRVLDGSFPTEALPYIVKELETYEN